MRLLIVDDHPIVISGFRAMIDPAGGIEVIEASGATAALSRLESVRVDLAVVDINLPGLSGFELARRIAAQHRSVRILMFSMNDDPVFVAQAMEIGAHGYISKNDNPANMLKAIVTVAAGGTAWPPGSGERIAHMGPRATAAPGARPDVSPRDQEILRLLAKGQSLSEIANVVGVSYKTIASACVQLRSKFSARTQMELIRIAVERKLV